MIQTKYTALESKGANISQQSYALSKNSQADSAVKQNITSNSGVILTLSSQARSKLAANSTVLKVGSRGEKVKELQRNLTKLGYDTKGTDGIFGNNTKKAVMEFQKAYSLTADGIVGAKTQSAIAKALDYHNKGILAVGSRGEKVKELQRKLTDLGYDTKGIDGIFGIGTKNAVIAFQKKHGLTADGIVGSSTRNVIERELKKYEMVTSIEPIKRNVIFRDRKNDTAVQKMLDNIRNDTSLGLSNDKKTAMLRAAERLLNDKFEPAFVAGVLGNIQREGTMGLFESSNYSDSDKRPKYLKHMDDNFNYRNRFSGKSIQEVGISAAIDLANKAKASGYEGKFGLGMIQWTEDRTLSLLKSYQKYAKSDKPTKEECIMAEVNFMADELKGSESKAYTEWKEGDQTASNAGNLVCRRYVRPLDTGKEARLRAQNAEKIYNVMMK